LNSLLDSYLPVDGLFLLVDFLGITDPTTKGYVPSASISDMRTADTADDDTEDPAFPLFSVVDACLVQAEAQVLMAENIATTEENENVHAGEGGDPFLNVQNFYHPLSHQFREAMYSALMGVMEERDEAHARMIATDVLHVHEIERIKKTATHLGNQLEMKELEISVLKRSTLAGKKDPTRADPIPDLNDRKTKTSSTLQDYDAELTSMCQQLATEISSRTSASLEILRLKESRQTERENEAAERLALEKELLQTKELLAQQNKKLEQTRQECSNWKQSYEKVLQRYSHK
jgi:hypothetical protein